MVQMLNEKPKLQQLTVNPFKIGGLKMRTYEYETYCAWMKEEKEMKETNLEHYKEQLKEIYNEHYDDPSDILDEIQSKIDSRIEASNYSTYTDDILNWMSQPYKEPILDDSEKEYLSAVIRPFRKEVDTISKFHTTNTMQYIYFQMKDKNGWTLPLFKKGTMYKGMVQGKHYTLDELGL